MQRINRFASVIEPTKSVHVAKSFDMSMGLVSGPRDSECGSYVGLMGSWMSLQPRLNVAVRTGLAYRLVELTSAPLVIADRLHYY